MFGNTSCPYLILEKDVELFRIPFHGDNASLKSLQKGYCFVEIPNSTVHTYYRWLKLPKFSLSPGFFLDIHSKTQGEKNENSS